MKAISLAVFVATSQAFFRLRQLVRYRSLVFFVVLGLIVPISCGADCALALSGDSGTKIPAPEQGFDYFFGESVSMSGSTAIVGAPGVNVGGESKAGAAYIYKPNEQGHWALEARLVANEPKVAEYFGNAVSISDNTAIMGTHFEPGNDGEGVAGTGVAFVFRKGVDYQWEQIAKLRPNDEAPQVHFGESVAISGSYAIVGAPTADNGGAFNTGAAYIFADDGHGNWSQTAKLLASNGLSYDIFGSSVAIDGNTAIVGAPVGDASKKDTRPAYVFENDGQGHWIETAKLSPPDAIAGDDFGTSVAIAGNLAVVGARFAGGSTNRFGAAYVFGKDETGVWTYLARLAPSDSAKNDWFGSSVAIDNTSIVVGSLGVRNYPSPNIVFQGAAYLFGESSTGHWDQLKKFVPDEVADTYAISVGISGSGVLVGAPGDNGTATSTGSAFAYPIPEPPVLQLAVAALGFFGIRCRKQLSNSRV